MTHFVEDSRISIDYREKEERTTSTVCTVKLRISPYTAYHGDAGTHHRGEKVTNQRLLGILKGVQQREVWSVLNCAEVQAAQHLFNNHFNISADQVEFAACDINGEPKSPCLNCQQWINKF